ncbi:hypothetical protein [Nonomuraea endophytica]|uniref:Uncharacterized protein n=1 Tax=Nonomuraea endophytica TaxID=714136 RepID=A0A7W8EH43_9ACTN|nr:hypothetical protein [Nonomuraea endophytica]MBB5080545.1 hypothetical protein [Nonomuraea endophytica]
MSGYRARWRGADYPASPDATALEVWVRLRRDEPAEGFTEVEPGCHVRIVPVAECEGLWAVFTVCAWGGREFLVSDEREDALLLEYLGGSTPEAVALGMERAERGVYRRWVPRAETGEPTEQALDIHP